jgi:23S rRNA (adenine2503-C2)-methyltransferase
MEIELDLKTKITNVVFMGMGEPLLNYKNVSRAVNILTHPLADMVSRRKITVSTSGVVPNIKKLANLQRPPKLAISLHGTTNGFRSKIMPINLKADISVLMNAVEEYYRKTKLNITYEYIPFEGMNDTIEDAKRLAKICKRVPSRINLIPFNDISFTEPTGIAETLKPTSGERIAEFANEIRSFGGVVTIRDTFGRDIDVACGQLALSERNKTFEQV